MRYAIIVEKKKIWVEYSEVVFLQVLKLNFEKTKNLDSAFALTKKQLENKIKYL